MKKNFATCSEIDYEKVNIKFPCCDRFEMEYEDSPTQLILWKEKKIA